MLFRVTFFYMFFFRRSDHPKGFSDMKHLFLAVAFLCLLCSCAHNQESRPLYASRFYSEKDAFLPNGWLYREDGFYTKPNTFNIRPYRELDERDAKYDDRANLFTVRTDDTPTLFYYSGYYEVDDDTIIDIESDAAGNGTFSLGVEFYDADQNFVGERHQGFDLVPSTGNRLFKNYRFRLYFLANENRRARFVRLMFITDPNTELKLRNISLDITPYDINLMDSTYIKFKEKEAKQGRKRK